MIILTMNETDVQVVAAVLVRMILKICGCIGIDTAVLNNNYSVPARCLKYMDNTNPL